MSNWFSCNCEQFYDFVHQHGLKADGNFMTTSYANKDGLIMGTTCHGSHSDVYMLLENPNPETINLIQSKI